MPPTSKSINLIRGQGSEVPGLSSITAIAQKIAYGSLLTLIISGILVGGGYLFLQAQESQVSSQKSALEQAVAADTTKEGLLTAVKQRADVASKLLGNQKNIDSLFSLVTLFVTPSQLAGLAMDDAGKASLTAHVASVGDAITLVDGLQTAVDAGKASKPELVKFSLAKQGGFDLSLSFVPILK